MKNTLVAPETNLTFGRFSDLVRGTLGVPAALVYTPAGTGGTESEAGDRLWATIGRAVCHLVTVSSRSVVIDDARTSEHTRDHPGIGDAVLVAYLAVPLKLDGRVVGALCAVDRDPRPWDERDRHVLTGLAAACSAELNLRDSRAQATAGRQRAESAQAVAEERGEQARLAQHRSEQITVATRRSERHARMLLVLSEALTATTTVDSVAQVVQDVSAEHLNVESSQISLGGEVSPGLSAGTRPQLHLPLSGGVTGSLALTWASAEAPPWADATGVDEVRVRETIEALVHYTSTALERAVLLQERRNAAATLQHALLTTLPARDDVHLAARYLPAAAANQVGGDWYDAVALPSPGGDQRDSSDLAVVIGDIAGHDIEAAATMGQVRSVLRGLLVDSPQAPAEMMTRLDTALTHLQITTGMSAVLGILSPAADDPGAQRLHWTNAGHPRPLLLTGDGRTELLGGGSDLMLGIPYRLPRHTQHHDLRPGDTLILYTDGLVQRPGRLLSLGQDLLAASVREHREQPLPELLNRVLGDLVDESTDDDCAILAVRLPR